MSNSSLSAIDRHSFRPYEAYKLIGCLGTLEQLGFQLMPQSRTDSVLGSDFAASLAAKDVASLKDILHPDVTFRGLTPSRFWEAKSAQEVIHILFDNWFEDKDHIREVLSVDTRRVEDRWRVEYRLRVNSGGQDYTVEQLAYYEGDSSKITSMSLLCSGYRPVLGLQAGGVVTQA